MRKKVRKKTPLPEIQEEGLLTPLRRGQSAYVQSTSTDFRRFADLEYGPQSESSLTSHVEMAAALVDQAMLGRWMPLAVVYHKDYESAKRAFLLYHKLYVARGLIYFLLMLLPFFEIPAWCDGDMPNPCGDPKNYPLSGLPYIQPWISVFIQVLCILVLVWSVCLQWYFLRTQFWLNRVGVYKVVVLSLLIVSTVASSIGLSEYTTYIDISMYIRLLVPIVFSRAIRGCFRMTLRIVHTFLDIAVLVGTFVLLSAWLATTLFSETSVEFKDFSTSVLSLFVLLTTANNPVVWASTYNANRFAFFFFFFYMVLGLYFLMNLAFSVIYSSYKAQMAVEVAKRSTARQGNLRAAFSLLDTRHQEWIDGATMIALFLAIGRYRHIPDVRARTSRLFLALNKRGDFKIWSDEFEELCDVIAKEVERQPDIARLKRRRSNPDLHFVKHPFYNYVIWALTLSSLSIAIAALNVTGTVQTLLINLEFVFGWIFVMDGTLKICVQGWKSYWRTHVNRFDFFVTILIVAVQVASFNFDIRFWVTYLIIARCFRVLALMTMISRWRLMGETLVYVIPATAPILALQFLVCSLFALLGMHLFGGLIYKDNPALVGTEYASHQFYAFNFNDYALGMATCFNLCVVNKWYVFMDAYAAVTGTCWSRAYFIAFWAIAVAFTLNVVVAFFAEAFTSQMEKAEKIRAREKRRSEEDLLPRGAALLRKKSITGGLPHRTAKSLSYYDLYEDIVKKS